MELSRGEIHTATMADVDNLVALVNSAYRGESSKKGWTTEADLLGGIRVDKPMIEGLINNPKNTILKYVIDDSILGCVNLEQKENFIYLGMLTVKPELQAAGIGKILLKAAEEFATKVGNETIEMTVIAARKELIDWYNRRGYETTSEKRPFPMNDPNFGIPKTHLEFVVLRKKISTDL